MKKRFIRYAIAALVVIAVLGLTFCLAVRRASADATGRPIVWYQIDAQLKLDERQRPTTVEGRELLTWLNDSPDPITDLQFHLFLNAFKNEKSTFFRESGGQLRGDAFEPGEWGWIDVHSLKIPGGEDLTRKIEFIHPDDDNQDDQTVIRVPLAKPVRPGERVTLEIGFTSRLPRVFARSGYWGQFAMVVQWFPRLGVWEAAGERRAQRAGWNCHQYHAHSEYYADFGVYDVNLTVPPSYKDKVGATGKLRSERVNQDGTITYNFYQENVHDFAWTADANYLKVTRAFKADEWVTPAEINEWSRRLQVPAEQIRLRDVEVTLLVQPEHRSQMDRHFRAAFNAIKYFGLWYGKYPYVTLTVVDPPYNGLGAAGMEYPTLITAGTTWWPGRDQNPEGVIVHEFGHQFWYGLIANNEFEESWLDEGFNTYSTGKVLEVAYGADALPLTLWGIPWGYFPFELPHPMEDRILTLQGKFNDPILTPAWKFYDMTSYGLNSYPRTGLTLRTLERYLGADLMARVMREYHQKWRFRHPASQDFFETASAISGQDLSWFFDQFVKGTQTLDYEISHTSSAKLSAKLGIYDQAGQRVEVKEDQNKQTEKESYETEVWVRRVGEAYFPVELLVTFEDGTQVSAQPAAIRDGAIEYQLSNSRDGSRWTDSWAIKDRWKKFKFTTPSKLQTARVDPEEKVLLDANLTNNSRTQDSGLGAALRWASGALFWLQAFLHTISFLS
jgi:hypothetical protein